jgi:hypothetical protein
MRRGFDTTASISRRLLARPVRSSSAISSAE